MIFNESVVAYFGKRGHLITTWTYLLKVEKILKGSLDSIPSPSRSCEHLIFLFSFFWPNIARHCHQTLLNKKFVDKAQQCFAFPPQANFPANNLNFHRRLSSKNLLYFTLTSTFITLKVE